MASRFSIINISFLIAMVLLIGCKQGEKSISNNLEKSVKEISTDKPEVDKIPKGWQEITTKETGILIDIRYATKNNFTNQKIYDCPRCFLRPAAAKKLVEVQQELKTRYGYGLKVYDCFRPKPYQQKLWDIKPDPSYVTPPEKGSMHSRGMAIDLTIVDKSGRELNMGTEYDYFGEEAHHDYSGFPADIQKNRVLIKKLFELHGFKSIRTEWWHYSLAKPSYALDKWVWACN